MRSPPAAHEAQVPNEDTQTDFPQMINTPVVVGIITFSGVWLIHNMAQKHKVIGSEGKCLSNEANLHQPSNSTE